MRCQAESFIEAGYARGTLGRLGPTLSKRRSKLPELTAFGAVLRSLRETRRLSTGQVERELTGNAKTPFTRSTLSQYEAGAVWSPDPVILAELARLYRAEPAGLIAVLKANRQTPDLTAAQADALRKGAVDEGAAAIGLLAEREEATARAMREINAIALRLIGIVEATAPAGNRKDAREEVTGSQHVAAARRKGH